MKQYVRFKRNNRIAYGLLREKTIQVLKGESPLDFTETDEQLPLDGVTLLPPVTPGKVVGVGLNYSDMVDANHAAFPQEPRLFLKSPDAIITSGMPIEKPCEVHDLTCEVELAVVIGRTARDVPPEKVGEVIWGYTVGNDVTASDLQKKDIIWGRCKSFDTFLPLGSVIVSDIDPTGLHLRCFRNGEKLIDSTPQAMIAPIDELVSFISHVMTLHTGDVILTGTPTGYGVHCDPGDLVRVEIEDIGFCENVIALRGERASF